MAIVSNKFKVFFPGSPDLGESVTYFNWDLYEKKFTLKIEENDNMDGFAWIQGITNAYDQARLHTHMANADMVWMTLLDKNNKEQALYRFAKLTLSAHNTEMIKAIKASKMIHHVEVTFERCEKDKEE